MLSTCNLSEALAIVAASGVILTAGYILWALQRVYLGAEYKGPHAEEITPINTREAAVASVLLALAVILGVFPNIIFSMMNGSITELGDHMQAGYEHAATVVNQQLQAMR